MNVATPDTAVAVLVPTRVPPDETVAVTTVEESDVTVLPLASLIATCGWVVNAAPAVVPTDARDSASCDGVLALTVTDALVAGLKGDPAWSVAVTVADPAVRRVTEKVLVPATSGAFAGGVADPSLEVIATVGVAVDTTFQFASTALTVTLNATPAS